MTINKITCGWYQPAVSSFNLLSGQDQLWTERGTVMGALAGETDRFGHFGGGPAWGGALNVKFQGDGHVLDRVLAPSVHCGRDVKVDPSGAVCSNLSAMEKK